MKKLTSVNPLTLYEKIGENTEPILFHEQMLHILMGTPKSHIYKRPAKGGGEWEFVTGAYIKKVLNYVFAWDWDFEVKDKGVEGSMMWVLGRLTVRTKQGRAIVKEQFGRAEMKKKKDGTGFLDYGNDLKAATTDALKKCASELGIASDVYAKNEFKQVQIESVEVVDVKNVAADKEKQKILTHIKNSEVIGELEMCVDYIVDDVTRAVYDKRHAELSIEGQTS